MIVNATGVVMIGSSHVAAAARFVRIVAATFVVTLLVAYIAIQAFASRYNEVPSARTVESVPTDSAALVVAITQQVSRGLTCREEPALTDTILFEAHDQVEVQVLTFDQALAAASAHTGWVRRYCF